MALDGKPRPERPRDSETAITARPADRCQVCKRPMVDGGCFYHPPGWSEIEAAKAAYREWMARHAALDDAGRAAFGAWAEGLETLG
jgi:hypothetical protein